MEVRYGRGLSDAEFASGSNTVVYGQRESQKSFSWSPSSPLESW
jgi:hypothetical protein